MARVSTWTFVGFVVATAFPMATAIATATLWTNVACVEATVRAKDAPIQMLATTSLELWWMTVLASQKDATTKRHATSIRPIHVQ